MAPTLDGLVLFFQVMFVLLECFRSKHFCEKLQNFSMLTVTKKELLVHKETTHATKLIFDATSLVQQYCLQLFNIEASEMASHFLALENLNNAYGKRPLPLRNGTPIAVQLLKQARSGPNRRPAQVSTKQVCKNPKRLFC